MVKVNTVIDAAAATTSVAGLESAADKAKLDGLGHGTDSPARAAARAASTQARALSDALSLTGLSPFLIYCNSIGTSLNVLHRYDEASGTSSADRRTGQTARTATFFTGTVRGYDTSLDRGSSKAAWTGALTAGITVDNYTGDTGGTLTYAMVLRFSRFHSTYTLVNGLTNAGIQVFTTDEGAGAKIQVKAAGLVVATSTVTITDTWKDHLIVVSMGGTTASTRIVIDGVECTGSITTRTPAAAADRYVYFSAGTQPLYVSAYAEWGRQLTTTEETNLLAACQFSYKPRPMLHGIHSGLQAKAVVDQQAVVDATVSYLAPHMSRFEVRWADIQLTNGGAYDWTKLDSAVDKTIAAGMEPLVTVLGSPTWANGGSSSYAIPAPAGFAAWVTAYTTFMTDVVTRYKGRVRYWELWNEPNFGNYNSGFWQPMAVHSTKAGWSGTTLTLADASGFTSSGNGSINLASQGWSDFAYTGKTGNDLTGVTTSDGAISGYANTTSIVAQYTSTQWGTDFANLSNALRTAILTVDPTAKVCTGGITSFSYGSNGLSGSALLTKAFANGLAAFSHYGLHPYPSNFAGPREVIDFSNAFADLRQLRSFLITNGRGNSTVWATEFGWFYDPGADTVAENAFLADSIYDLLNYYSSFVDLFCYFVDHDRVANGFYGVLTDAPYTPKALLADTFKTNALYGAAQPEPPVTIPTLALSQPLDSDLVAIAALSPANNDLVQRKSGAWTNRTPAQVKTDLAIASGDVSGLGTAAVTNTGTGATNTILGNDARLTDTRTPTDATVTTAKVVDANVTLAKQADVATARIMGRTTAGTGAQEAMTVTQTAALLAGTSATTLAVGNDSRLSDTRTPTDASVTRAKEATVAANTVRVNATGSTATPTDMAMAASTILARLASGDIVAGTVTQITALLAGTSGATLAVGNDSRLSDSRTPTGSPSPPVNVQYFTVANTDTNWEKPTAPTGHSAYSIAEVICIGGGGGGAAGQKAADSTLRYGGGGGGGGGYVRQVIDITTLGANVTVAVGAGGGGESAVTVNSTASVIATAGGTSSFGAVWAGGGNAGLGSTFASIGSQGGYGSPAGTWGAAGVSTGVPVAANSSGTSTVTGTAGGLSAAGGGAGGEITAANGLGPGSAGGGQLTSNPNRAGGTNGAASTGTANAGGPGVTPATASTANEPVGGAGGGGGGCGARLTSGNGGTGGAGALYGGGGGGGGGATNSVGNSGAGGAGASGIVMVISR